MTNGAKFMDYGKKILKQNADKPISETESRLYEAFIKSLPNLPKGMEIELADYFFQPMGLGIEDFYPMLETAAAFSEIFWEEYNEDEAALSDDDWRFIRDVVNDYALNLTDDFLFYVMEIITRKKLLD